MCFVKSWLGRVSGYYKNPEQKGPFLQIEWKVKCLLRCHKKETRNLPESVTDGMNVQGRLTFHYATFCCFNTISVQVAVGFHCQLDWCSTHLLSV